MVTGLLATPPGTPFATWPSSPRPTLLPTLSPPPLPAIHPDPCHPLPRYTSVVSYKPVSRILGAAFTEGGGENIHSGQKPHGAWRIPWKNPRPYERHSCSTVLAIYTYTSMRTS